MLDEAPPGEPRERRYRDVVDRGAEAAYRYDGVAPAERMRDGLRDAAGVVADGRLVVALGADRGEGAADEGRVGVRDVAQEELRADGDDFSSHTEDYMFF